MTLMIVSHSLELANSLKKYLIDMINIKNDLEILTSGFNIENELGTNFLDIKQKIENSKYNDVLIVCDLGSSVLSSISAKELIKNKNIKISKGSFLEGSFAACALAKQKNIPFNKIFDASNEILPKY